MRIIFEETMIIDYERLLAVYCVRVIPIDDREIIASYKFLNGRFPRLNFYYVLPVT